MPEDMAQLFAQIFSQGPMRMTYKYDDQDRVIEQTQAMGLFGYEKTVSFYNEHGDLSKQQSYSTRQDVPVDEKGDALRPPPATERLESEMGVSYEYDNRGNWTLKKTATLHRPQSRWESVEKRSITYH
jgi:YD repeat-containing protein